MLYTLLSDGKHRRRGVNHNGLGDTVHTRYIERHVPFVASASIDRLQLYMAWRAPSCPQRLGIHPREVVERCVVVATSSVGEPTPWGPNDAATAANTPLHGALCGRGTPRSNNTSTHGPHQDSYRATSEAVQIPVARDGAKGGRTSMSGMLSAEGLGGSLSPPLPGKEARRTRTTPRRDGGHSSPERRPAGQPFRHNGPRSVGCRQTLSIGAAKTRHNRSAVGHAAICRAVGAAGWWEPTLRMFGGHV